MMEIPTQEQGPERPPEAPDAGAESPSKDPDEKALEDIGRGRQEIDQLEQRAEVASERAHEASDRIKDIRNELGLPPAEVMTETQRALTDIEKRIGDKDKDLDAKETEFLGIPEGESEPISASEQMLDLAEEAERELGREQEAMERRQKVAEDYINRTDAWVEEKFGTYFKDAVNGKKAQQLMNLKIKAGVGFAAAKYIEEGSEVNRKELGFVAGLTVDKIKDKDGNERPFITEVDVDMGAEAVKSFLEAKEGKKADKGELMDSKERKELLDAEKEGRVTKEEQDKGK